MTWELLEGVYTLHDHTTNADITGETNIYLVTYSMEQSPS